MATQPPPSEQPLPRVLPGVDTRVQPALPPLCLSSRFLIRVPASVSIPDGCPAASPRLSLGGRGQVWRWWSGCTGQCLHPDMCLQVVCFLTTVSTAGLSKLSLHLPWWLLTDRLGVWGTQRQLWPVVGFSAPSPHWGLSSAGCSSRAPKGITPLKSWGLGMGDSLPTRQHPHPSPRGAQTLGAPLSQLCLGEASRAFHGYGVSWPLWGRRRVGAAPQH